MSTVNLNLTIAGKTATAVSVSAVQRSDGATISGLSLPLSMSASGNVWSVPFTDANRAPFYTWSGTITYSDGQISPLLTFNTAGGILPVNVVEVNGAAATTDSSGTTNATGVPTFLKAAGGTLDHTTGAIAFDSTPTAAAWKSGAVDDTFTVAAAAAAAGTGWRVTGTVPAYALDTTVSVRLSGTNGGVATDVLAAVVQVVALATPQNPVPAAIPEIG